MMTERATIAVTRVIPDAGMEMLRAAEAAGEIQLRVWEDELPPPPADLAALLDGCAGAVTLLTDKIDGALLDRRPTIKVVSNFAVGYDNINVPDCTARGVAVCNTPGVLTETTADFAFALLMAAARRVVEGVDYVRAGKWRTWGPTLLMGRDLYNATIGIVGFGRIGKEMAKRARGFDMRILAFDAYPDHGAAAELGVTFVELDELLRESDFVSLHCALTENTRHLIGAHELELMKREAVLVNAARGPVVDTEALLSALRDGTIWSAALDVTDPEPLPPDHPLIFLPNCVVVPHIASATVQTRSNMATTAASNALAVIRGETPPACVNPEVLGSA
jgi:glyoxylate reductase